MFLECCIQNMSCVTRVLFFKQPILLRFFHTSCIQRLDHKTAEEIKIPVHWGHIAGKRWGKKNIQPILAVHGWHDNAGSWDPLCELIPDDFSVLAVDLPGHGQSSHLPPSQYYSHYDYIHVLRMIKKYIGLENMDLLGHSEGSAISFSYATVFPEDVKSYLGIDYLANCYLDENDRAETIGDFIDEKIKYGLRDQASSSTYSWEEARQKWATAFPWSLNEKTAEILMKRGVDAMPDGKYRFSRDQRLKVYESTLFSPKQILTLAENLQCHVRLVKATKSILFDTGLRFGLNVLNTVERKAKSFKLHEINGNHHLHMDMPAKILPVLLELLQNSRL